MATIRVKWCNTIRTLKQPAVLTVLLKNTRTEPAALENTAGKQPRPGRT